MLPQGLNTVLYSYLMGTSADLNASENVAVMNYMDEEVIKLAKRKQFVGVLTTNTSPLTQQLDLSINGFTKMLDYQINEYVHTDGSTPFGRASDSERAIVCWKEV